MYFQWKPYVSVAQRRAQAVREMKQLEKGGLKIQPISLEGRKIARTFAARDEEELSACSG